MNTRRASAFQILCQTIWLNYAVKIFSFMYVPSGGLYVTRVLFERNRMVSKQPIELLAGTFAIHQDTFTV